MILTEIVPKTDPRRGEVIPKRERLSTDTVGLSTEKGPLIKGRTKENNLNIGLFRGKRGGK